MKKSTQLQQLYRTRNIPEGHGLDDDLLLYVYYMGCKLGKSKKGHYLFQMGRHKTKLFFEPGAITKDIVEFLVSANRKIQDVSFHGKMSKRVEGIRFRN